MNILVTGGAGFIGSHLVDELIKRKNAVTVVDDLSCGRKIYVNPKARFIKTKVQNQLLERVFAQRRFTHVYHLAAQKNLQYSKDHPVEDAATNILGSLNVLSLAKRHRVKKLVFYSTAAVYDPEGKLPNRETDALRPVTPYGIAKRSVEQYLEHSGVPWVVLRLSNVYGPRQDAEGEGGVVAIFSRLLVQGKRCTIYNTGRQTRDYIYVSDVVVASVAAAQGKQQGVYNVSTGKETTVNELYRIMADAAGISRQPRRGQSLPEQFRSVLSNARAKRQFDWKPRVSLDVGIQQTVDWFKRQ